MKKVTATPNGRFKKGSSGNPSGRPIGSRNKSTILAEQIIGDDLQEIARKLTELAKAGNIHAIKLCLERTIPVQRERTIELPLELAGHPSNPPISHRGILIAIANSTITPAEGLAMSTVVIAHEDSMERDGFEEDEPEEESEDDRKVKAHLMKAFDDYYKAPKITTPKPKAPKITTLKPKAAKVTTPKPIAAKIKTPKPKAPKPKAPKPKAPKPKAPEVTTPKPEAVTQSIPEAIPEKTLEEQRKKRIEKELEENRKMQLVHRKLSGHPPDVWEEIREATQRERDEEERRNEQGEKRYPEQLPKVRKPGFFT